MAGADGAGCSVFRAFIQKSDFELRSIAYGFSSLFFLYVFLPLNLLFYHLMPSMRAKNTVMMIFSLIFYAWGEPVYVFCMHDCP